MRIHQHIRHRWRGIGCYMMLCTAINCNRTLRTDQRPGPLLQDRSRAIKSTKICLLVHSIMAATVIINTNENCLGTMGAPMSIQTFFVFF